MAKAPTNNDVLAMLRVMGSSGSGTRLLAFLKAEGFDGRETQRVIQRCLDQGLISLGRNLRLSIEDPTNG